MTNLYNQRTLKHSVRTLTVCACGLCQKILRFVWCLYLHYVARHYTVLTSVESSLLQGVKVGRTVIFNEKHLKNVGPIRHRAASHQFTRYRSVLSHAACASMSTMTTTTTRDRGDRYGPMKWAQRVEEEGSVMIRMLDLQLNGCGFES